MTEISVAPNSGATESKGAGYVDPAEFAKTVDSRKVIDWALTNFQSIKRARTYTERQWYLNLCFYYGKQNVVFRPNNILMGGASSSLYTPPMPYWRVRLVLNRIRPTIRKEVAKLTAQKPTAYVVPSTTSDEDLFAAQAGEQIWESIYQGHELKKVFRRWIWWGLICGTSFLKCCWDPDAVDVQNDQMGNLKYKHETPFHVFAPEFREEDIENQPFIINAHVKTEDWVSLNYPDAMYSARQGRENDIIDQSWLNLVGASDATSQKGVLCLEVWLKPGANKMFPQGAMFTVVGDTLVQLTEGWPYEATEYPFAKLDHIPTGKFYCASSIEDLVPIQREYNRTRSQLVENKNRMAKPQLAAEKGSIEPEKMTSEPGLVVEYEGGYQPPTPIPLTPMPAYVTDEISRLLGDFEDISGQHEVSKGTTPPGVTAATAINFLQEQDDSILSHTFGSLEEGIEKIARLTLQFVHQYWDTPRIVKITGTDGSFDSEAFKGSDLRDNTDIRVEGGSALPTSKAAKQAFIMDLIKLGIIDGSDGLEVMEMGGIQKIYEKIQVDVNQARRENLRMAAIVPEQQAQFDQMQAQDALQSGTEPPTDPAEIPILVPVNTYDNDAIHLEIHNRHRKSQAFENANDAVKQTFEIHCQQHEASMYEKQMKQMAMMAPPGEGLPPEAQAGDKESISGPMGEMPPPTVQGSELNGPGASGSGA